MMGRTASSYAGRRRAARRYDVAARPGRQRAPSSTRSIVNAFHRQRALSLHSRQGHLEAAQEAWESRLLLAPNPRVGAVASWPVWKACCNLHAWESQSQAKHVHFGHPHSRAIHRNPGSRTADRHHADDGAAQSLTHLNQHRVGVGFLRALGAFTLGVPAA